MIKKKWYALFILMAVLAGCNKNDDILQSENSSYVSSEITMVSETIINETEKTEDTAKEETTIEEITIEETAVEETTTEAATTESPQTTVAYERLELAETAIDADCSLVAEEYENCRESIAGMNEELANKHNIAVISFTTEGGREVESKTEYIPAIVDVVGCDEEYLLSASAGIKIRGNSTAGTAEKPYRIKFEEKQNLLGLHDGRKYRNWVLLKADWNVCSDYTGLKLAKVVLGDQVYSSDCTFVQVYINGKNKGIYTLCEQNQANDGRVEIKEADMDAKYPEAPEKIGYFLEIDNNASEENPYFKMDYNKVTVTDYAGQTRKMGTDNITIKSDVTTKEQYEFIKKYMEGTFTILYEGCCNGKAFMFDKNYNLVSAEDILSPEEAVEKVIDVDSFINMTILYELTQDYDVGAGSFYFAVDFREEAKIKKLTCVAPWDFNWGYGENPDKNFYACAWLEVFKDNWDRSNIWLIVPMTADWYQQRMISRWQEISKSKKIDKVLKAIEKDVDVLVSEVGNKDWRISCAKDVINFVKRRIRFLDKTWSK